MNAIHFMFRMSIIVFLAITIGCVSVPSPGQSKFSGNQPATPASEKKVYEVYYAASAEAEVCEAIQLMEAILAQGAADKEMMARLSNLYIYKGAALETRVSKKRESFVQAMAYAEAIMMQSPLFRSEVECGVAVWDAVDVLDEEFVPALCFWSTALFYQFDECVNKMVKPFHLRWINRAEAVQARAYELDPDWGGGQLYFSYGIYYLMPAIAGGDMEKSKVYFDKAVDAGPEWLVNRWGRGRYYYRKVGDLDALRDDLEWVLSQDASKAPGPLFWNLYCQRDAERMLSDL